MAYLPLAHMKCLTCEKYPGLQSKPAANPAVAPLRRTTNARRWAKNARVCGATNNLQPITISPTASKKATQLEEEVQGICGDYFAALRAYRQMQAKLGPEAAQAARQLSSNPQPLRSGQNFKAAAPVMNLDQAAAALDGVTREGLAELVSLRRSLLHELPRIRSQVMEVMEGHAYGNIRGAELSHFQKADGTNANSLFKLEVVPNSVNQWVRTKEYSMKKARSKNNTNNRRPDLTDTDFVASNHLAPGLQQQYHLRQQSYAQGQAPLPLSVSTTFSRQSQCMPPINMACSNALSTAPQQQQQQPLLADELQPRLSSPSAPSVPSQAHLPEATGSSTVGQPPFTHAGLTSTGTCLDASSLHNSSATVLNPSLPLPAVDGTANGVKGVSGPQPHVEQGANSSGIKASSKYLDAQLNAPNNRLHQAALKAAAYKQQQGGGAKANSSKSKPAAGEQRVQDAAMPGAVELGDRQAVYSAPRRSRANGEEASFLVCP